LRYETAEAFRAALEIRIGRKASDGVTVARLRKLVVFERFLRRLEQVAPDGWLLKGGFALELRLAGRARATKDIDLDWQLDEEDAIELLLDAAQLDLGDFFEFALERAATAPDLGGRGQRWRATARLAGRTFEQVIVDLDFSIAAVLDPERLRAPGLLEFADLEPATVPAAALEQHLAEKVHAYTRRYGQDQPSSRPKDLIDMVLIAGIAGFEATRARDAIGRVFDARGTHRAPTALPAPPPGWAAPYARLAKEVDLPDGLDAGHTEATALVDPLLSGAVAGCWDAGARRWRARR
jgi:predicted nucleotidyltransferase component of viral defense system